MREKSEKEHLFTSTGIKFWKHKDQMTSYKNNNGSSIISTHIAPEGSCNLNCSYCSVKKRNRAFRIELDVIKDYVEKLITRGLKAVILTGGGEPLLYPKINELVSWLKLEKGLDVALITNGTCTHLLDDWSMFSWIRVSINNIDNWLDRLTLPIEKIPKETVIGCSYINTGKFEEHMSDLSFLLDKLRAEYLRVLPNCLLSKEVLIKEHSDLEHVFNTKVTDKRFFQQYKFPAEPNCDVCHQSYFRPYLSEVGGGTVYPCDSIVLNNSVEHFHEKYALCRAGDILDYLDKKIISKFIPKVHCTGCVFYDNNNLIDSWVTNNVDKFSEYKGVYTNHDNFV